MAGEAASRTRDDRVCCGCFFFSSQVAATMSRFASRLSLLLLTLALAATGCRSGGDLIANPHKVTDEARMVANAMPQAAPIARELAKLPLPRYFVQPGDALLIEPSNPNDAPRVAADQTVLPDGTIDLGVYGRPVVAGLTVEEIEQVTREAICSLEPRACDPPEDLPKDPVERATLLAKLDRGPVNVRLIGPESTVFYALGEVAAPGAYPLVGRETVLDALLKAGGLTDRADRCNIILARPTGPYECRVVLQICYDRLVQLGDATTNYQVLPGDRLFVASKTFCDSMRGIMFFWEKDGCPHCCDTGSCPCPCPTTIASLESPFIRPTTGYHPGPVLGTPLTDLSTPQQLPAAEGDDADSKDEEEEADDETEDDDSLPTPEPPGEKPAVDALTDPTRPATDLPEL